MAKAAAKNSEAATPQGPHVCPTCGQVVPGVGDAPGVRPEKAPSGKAAGRKCLKGKSEVSEAEAEYVCKKCGALTDEKDHVCKPEKMKKDKKDKKDKKKEKKEKKEKKKDEKKEKKNKKK